HHMLGKNTTSARRGAGGAEAGSGSAGHWFTPQGRSRRALLMSRMSLLSSPLLLGFEDMERLIDRVGKGDGYPPYNIERISADGPSSEGSRAPGTDRLRITLAVAGFRRDQLEITVEDNQLVIRGRQEDDKSREFLHRGIAARQFSRAFVLADGIEVKS